jgi:uncharacterized membrane protein
MTNRTLARAVTVAVLLAARLAVADPPAPRRLIYAVYASETAANDVFKALRSAEDRQMIRIDSYAVVTKDPDGKVRVKDQRRRETAAGATVGAVVGLLGGPVGVALGAAAGGAAGYLTGKAVGMPAETVQQIKDSLQPGQSAIMAVVDDQWAAEVARLQQAEAQRIVTHPVPPEPSTTGKPPNPAP